MIQVVPFDDPDAVALRSAHEAYGDELYANDPASKHRFTSEVGSGVADALLAAVEQRVRDEGAPRVVIHTGDRQHAALRFYERHGYTPIDVFSPYEAIPYSRCYERVF